jgi:3-phosphoshikimate 1-carboxyvinyltransferase
MPKIILIKKKINSFKKVITVDGDKSLSIRWALLASQANGRSRAYNLLKSEDVSSTLDCLKKLGIQINQKKEYCEIIGNGVNSFKFKKKIVLNAGNSGTLSRLIPALLLKSPYKIKLIGDKSLSKRDFSRIKKPLEKFGASFFPPKKTTLPLFIKGNSDLKGIKYNEKKGSAQIKSCVMMAALNATGETIIKAKKSRNHTELMFKNLKIPIKIKKTKNFDFIKIKKIDKIKSINYNIPSDISSSAFFIVLTILSNNSQLLIKKVNINPTRIGIIKILKMMGAKIIFKNKKKYKGEKIADIFIKSQNNLKGIKCPQNLNSSCIDEFLIIFLVAAKAKGISYFRDLAELNQKESPRLNLGSKILNMMGVKTELTKSSIKIYGNPHLDLKGKCVVKDYLKDHRVFMMSVIAALTIGGDWKIYDPDSIKTSFPSFLNLIKLIGGQKSYE